jgi:hypothetical protein
MINMTCPCGKRFLFRDDMAGKRGRCPKCERELCVPAPPPEASAADDQPATVPAELVDRVNSLERANKRLTRLDIGAAAIAAVSLGLIALSTRPVGLVRDQPVAHELSQEEADQLSDQAFDRLRAASDQFWADLSDRSERDVDRRKAEYNAVIERVSVRYRDLLEEAARCFPDSPHSIYIGVNGTRRRLAEDGIKADTAEMLRGAIRLVKNSHSPRPNTQHIFAFNDIYEMRRKEGLGHEQAIQKMFDLEKF